MNPGPCIYKAWALPLCVPNTTCSASITTWHVELLDGGGIGIPRAYAQTLDVNRTDGNASKAHCKSFVFYAYFKRISETKMKEILRVLSTSDRTHSKGRKIKRSKSGKRIFATPKVVQQQNKVPSLSCGFQGNVGHKGVSHSYCFQCFFITKLSAFLS